MQNMAMMIWVYAAIMAVGGVIGYFKVHSKASLISGVGFGLLLLGSGYGVWQGSRARDSLVASAVIAALLVVIFAIRVIKTRRLIPAGMLAVLSVLALALFLSKLISFGG
jgi:uncharacterized membrane protein (UPF0136 family)